MTTTVNHTELEPDGSRIPIVILQIAPTTDTNQAAALAEYPLAASTQRAVADLRAAKFARISANVGATAAVSGAYLQGQYSLDGGSNWLFLNGLLTTAGGPKTLIDDDASTTVGPWSAIADGAKRASVLVRIVSTGGDGVVDPTIGTVQLQVAR